MTSIAIPRFRTGGPQNEPPEQEPKDPKRWEKRMVFIAGWIIGLIILKVVFHVDL